MLACTIGVGRRLATLTFVVVADRAQEHPAWAEHSEKLAEGTPEVIVGEQMRHRIVECQYHIKRSRNTRSHLAHVSHCSINNESPSVCLRCKRTTAAGEKSRATSRKPRTARGKVWVPIPHAASRIRAPRG